MKGDIVGINGAAKYLGISVYKVKKLIKLKLIDYRMDGVNFEIMVFYDWDLKELKKRIKKLTFKTFCKLYSKIE